MDHLKEFWEATGLGPKGAMRESTPAQKGLARPTSWPSALRKERGAPKEGALVAAAGPLLPSPPPLRKERGAPKAGSLG